jgi:glycerol kinase
LTTYRRLAEEVVDLLAPLLGSHAPQWTARAPLPGGDMPGADFERFRMRTARRFPWLDPALLQRYVRAYGTRIDRLLDGCEAMSDLGESILPGLHVREIDYLRREEFAVDADDILYRRSKLGVHPAARQHRTARPVARQPAGKRMKRFVLALDQGTTSSRSILFDHRGQPQAMAQRELTQHFPRSGWVEHDAEEIWATQAATITEVLARARTTLAEVVAIGITNQRETTVLWDRASGRPVAPAIVWQDRRTADACARLQQEGLEPEVARRTGLLLDPYFSGTKLAWLLDNVPHARSRAERGELAFGTIDSWLIWQLTRGARHITDATNASRTLLLNLATGGWDDTMLDLLRIPRAVLPEIVPSMLGSQVALATLGADEVPITGIAGDQQAALFGQCCFEPGMAKNTYGTGCFLLMNTGREPLVSANRLLTTIAWQTDARHYALEGAVFVGGAVVQWLRDGLGFFERSEEVEALAATVLTPAVST